MNDHSEAIGIHRFPLGRRAIMGSGLVTGLTLAAVGAEAQAVHTDSTGVVADDIQVPSYGGNIPAYFARPDKEGSFPIVLLIEAVSGIDDYLKDVCRRFAKAGYLAIVPEVYVRQGDLSKMTDIPQIFSQVISKTPDAQIMGDLDAAAAWAAQNHGDVTKLAVTGFCRGGRGVWLYAAHNPQLKAAVAWYGVLGGSTSDIQPKTALDLADQLQCPLLGLYGGKDASIPVDQVRTAEARAKAAGKTVEIVIYPEAGHAFHSDTRPSYNREAAEDGWRRTLAWFGKYGVAPTTG